MLQRTMPEADFLPDAAPADAAASAVPPLTLEAFLDGMSLSRC